MPKNDGKGDSTIQEIYYDFEFRPKMGTITKIVILHATKKLYLRKLRLKYQYIYQISLVKFLRLTQSKGILPFSQSMRVQRHFAFFQSLSVHMFIHH